MFTGLVECLAVVSEIKLTAFGGLLSLKFSKREIIQEVRIGDSIAVNGVCLTAVDKKNGMLTFQVSEETLGRTNLKFLKRGDFVNIERSLTPNKPLGGHLVYGHVDTLGRIERIIPRGENRIFEISFEEKYSKYLVEKGSVAVDGISLTVNELLPRRFRVNIIPHTFENTNLKYRRVGDFVNLEFDILGKYIIDYFERIIRKEKLFRTF